MDGLIFTRINSAAELRTLFASLLKTEQNTLPLPKGKIGALQGRLHEVWPGDNLRYLCLGYLFTPPGKPIQPMHSRELSPGMWHIISAWVSDYDIDGVWLPGSWFRTQASQVQAEAIKIQLQGQSEIPMVEAAIQEGGKITDILPADEPSLQVQRKTHKFQTRTDYFD